MKVSDKKILEITALICGSVGVALLLNFDWKFTVGIGLVLFANKLAEHTNKP